jgi:hypothetical protein
MTFDGLLTFITLVIAALAFMPALFILRMRVVLGRWIAIAAVGLLLVLYFEFFRVVGLKCPTILGVLCDPLFAAVGTDPTQGALIDNREAAFLVVLLWILVSGLLLGRTDAPVRALKRIERVINRLAVDRRFQDLIDLAEPNLPLLERASNRKLRRQRLHDWLSSPTLPKRLDVELIIDGGELRIETPPKPTRREMAKRWFESAPLKGGRWLANVLPSAAGAENTANDILRFIMKNRGLLDHIVTVRPAFGARLMGIAHYLADDFASDFLRALLNRPGSALYEEIAASQSTTRTGYALAPEAIILRSLFDNVETGALRLGAERAIGERAMANLEPGDSSSYAATLNLRPDVNWDEYGKWEDPTFIAITFFDLMVTSAAEQGVTWHMSLTYMRDFVRALVSHYDESGPNIDSSGEWPTRNAYLLYCIISALRDWVHLADKLPADSPHHRPENALVDYENGNIPKTAAIILGACLATIIKADQINTSFKRYLFDIAIRSVVEFDPKSEASRLREATLRSIAAGGIIDQGPGYRNQLCDLYADLDPLLHFRLRDLEPMIAWPPALKVAQPSTFQASPAPTPAPALETTHTHPRPFFRRIFDAVAALIGRDRT